MEHLELDVTPPHPSSPSISSSSSGSPSPGGSRRKKSTSERRSYLTKTKGERARRGSRLGRKVPFFFKDSWEELSKFREEMEEEERERVGGDKGKEIEKKEKKNLRHKLTHLQRQGTVALLDMMTKAEPTFEENFRPKIAKLVEMLSNLVAFLHKLYKKCEEKELLSLIPVIYGLFCLLFGVHFRMVITFVEAVRYTSLAPCEEALNDLIQQGTQIQQRYEEEYKIEPAEEESTFFQKCLLLLRTMEPQVVGNAIAILYASGLAVLACLRVKVAQNFALGLSIGDVFSKAALQELPPILMVLVNEPYHQWIEPFLCLVCRCLACWMAFFLSRYLTLMHSVIRGSQMTVRGLVAHFYGAETADKWEGTAGFLFVQITLLAIGVSFQLQLLDSYPIFLSLLLLPFSLFESFLVLTLGAFDLFIAEQSLAVGAVAVAAT